MPAMRRGTGRFAADGLGECVAVLGRLALWGRSSGDSRGLPKQRGLLGCCDHSLKPSGAPSAIVVALGCGFV